MKGFPEVAGFPCWWILAGHPVTQATVRFWDVSEHQPVVAWQTEESASDEFLKWLATLMSHPFQRLLIVESIHWSEFHRANCAIYFGILWSLSLSLSLSLCRLEHIIIRLACRQPRFLGWLPGGYAAMLFTKEIQLRIQCAEITLRNQGKVWHFFIQRIRLH